MQSLFDDLQAMLVNINENNSVFPTENKKQTIYYYHLIMCLSQLILDKTIFKKNKILVEFLQDNYKFEYPMYITKSRMMILGRTIQNISKVSEIEDIKVFLNRTYESLKKIEKNEDLNKSNDWSDAIFKMKIK